MKNNIMMKCQASLLTLAICSASAYAQNGFYGALSAGGGITSMKTGATYYNQQGSNIDQSATFGYNAKLTLGYQYKQWRFQTGLQYLKTGYELKHLQFGADFDPTLAIQPATGNYKLTYGHIGIPLQVGFVIAPAKRLTLVPYIGMLTTYNTGANAVLNASGNETSTRWSKTDFQNRYNSFSIWTTASLYLEYKISNRVSLFGGPSAHYMMSNFGNAMSGQKNHIIGIDLGIKIRL